MLPFLKLSVFTRAEVAGVRIERLKQAVERTHRHRGQARVVHIVGLGSVQPRAEDRHLPVSAFVGALVEHMAKYRIAQDQCGEPKHHKLEPSAHPRLLVPFQLFWAKFFMDSARMTNYVAPARYSAQLVGTALAKLEKRKSRLEGSLLQEFR